MLIDANPELVIEQIKAAKLRGRGGAGFLTGLKWEFLRKAVADQKYIICNADEGDPGAYMNRNEIESDPHSLLEGMIIGGYVMGATEGIVYVRAEYPLAVHRLRRAIEQARAIRRAGRQHSGPRLQFRHPTGGRRRRVRVRRRDRADRVARRLRRTAPAAPAVPGAKGPVGQAHQHQQRRDLVQHRAHRAKGPAWFSETGSTKSAGTKVFSLVGKITNTGLVEMPLGTPLKTLHLRRGRRRRRRQARSKPCRPAAPPAAAFRTKCSIRRWITRRLAQLGSIMGSGGMVVMDEDNCMVDVARYFIEFTHSESCGKCVPCRVGLDKCADASSMRFTKRHGPWNRTCDRLDELGRMIRDTSLCGLGQSAPNPLLTTMRHFRHEFEDHMRRQALPRRRVRRAWRSRPAKTVARCT